MLDLIETGSAARDQENEELRKKVVSLEKQLRKSKQSEMMYTKKFRTLKSSFREVQKQNSRLKTHARKRQHDEVATGNLNTSEKSKNVKNNKNARKESTEQPADKKLLMSEKIDWTEK